VTARVPRVMRSADLVPGPPTPGVDRLTAFEEDERWIGFSRAAPGTLSGWHHHGAHDSYFYVVGGTAYLELADGEQIRVRPGDFALLPAGTVHREGTEGDVALEAVVIRLGSGPQVFPVDDPRPADEEA
jgi:mannose-6-phosphate isomerase-like protein (cupin superfamily)